MFEVNEKNNAVTTTEHYDGATLKDVYGAAYRPEGNKARYIETRVYLQQVRDEKHRVDLIKSRIQYRNVTLIMLCFTLPSLSIYSKYCQNGFCALPGR